MSEIERLTAYANANGDMAALRLAADDLGKLREKLRSLTLTDALGKDAAGELAGLRADLRADYEREIKSLKAALADSVPKAAVAEVAEKWLTLGMCFSCAKQECAGNDLQRLLSARYVPTRVVPVELVKKWLGDCEAMPQSYQFVDERALTVYLPQKEGRDVQRT